MKKILATFVVALFATSAFAVEGVQAPQASEGSKEVVVQKAKKHKKVKKHKKAKTKKDHAGPAVPVPAEAPAPAH